MECINCHSNDWENVDEFRLKPVGMSICKTCGFVSYPSLWKSKEDILAFYKKDYRKPPTASNLFTGQRKVYFHDAFIGETLDAWKANSSRSYKVCEVGAAYGVALQWIRSKGENIEVFGTELTESFKRNAYWEYGLKLSDDIDESLKYDMIMTYKVAEHQLDFDKELKRYRELLNDDGLLYIGVPIWFETAHNFGLDGFDLEYYYDTNHINVWSLNIFKGLLTNAGFEIIKEDNKMYDYAFLCKKSIPAPSFNIDSPEETKSKMRKMKEAFMLNAGGKHQQALDVWPNYPSAHSANAEMNRQEYLKKGWAWVKENVVEKAIADCPTVGGVPMLGADWAMRFNEFPDAIRYIELSLKQVPENVPSYTALINCMRELAIRSTDDAQKYHYFNEARKIASHVQRVSLQSFAQMTDMKYLYNAQLPIPENT